MRTSLSFVCRSAILAAAASMALPALAGDGVTYHPLRDASSKRASALKPDKQRQSEVPPIMVELRAHYHEDGTISYSCDQDHAELPAKRAETTAKEPQQ